MKRIGVEELKKLQLEILSHVAEFCDKNNIHYWLDCGTLLGAVRHKGYIPWDDDIDIGMLRPDYDKFFELFNKENKRYRFVCFENDPTFFLPHGKVLDTGTVLYEPNEKGNRLSVNIDVFVYDNAPDDDEILKEMFDERDRLRDAYNFQHMRGRIPGSFSKKISRLIRRTYYAFRHHEKDVSKQIANSRRFINEQTKRVGNFTSYARTACDRHIFYEFVDVDFEGLKFKAPKGYHEWLSSFYGDYMQLPPENKRVSHHAFVAYIVDEEPGEETASEK